MLEAYVIVSKEGLFLGENTKRGALLHGVPYGVPKMEYP